MSDWAAWLLDASGFVPRSMCGDWPPVLFNANVAANAVTWLSYLFIAGSVAAFYRRIRGRIGGAWFATFLSAFVAWCSVSHLCDVLVFWWPAYRLFTGVDAVTALVSFAAAVAISPVLDYLASLPSYEEVAAERDAKSAALTLAAQRGREIEEMHIAEANTNSFLRSKLAILEDRLRSESDFYQRMDALDQVRAIVATLPEGGAHDRPLP